MLSLVNIGKAETKSTASTTNEIFMQEKVRIGESLLLIVYKILAKGGTIWFGGWFWSMEPYHRIVIEAGKFSPKFASRGSSKQWPIYTYRPKNI